MRTEAEIKARVMQHYKELTFHTEWYSIRKGRIRELIQELNWVLGEDERVDTIQE